MKQHAPGDVVFIGDIGRWGIILDGYGEYVEDHEHYEVLVGLDKIVCYERYDKLWVAVCWENEDEKPEFLHKPIE